MTTNQPATNDMAIDCEELAPNSTVAVPANTITADSARRRASNRLFESTCSTRPPNGPSSASPLASGTSWTTAARGSPFEPRRRRRTQRSTTAQNVASGTRTVRGIAAKALIRAPDS